MKILGDIMIPLRKYKDKNTGEDKTAWGRCGVLMQNKDGAYRIKMDMMPLDPGEGWFAVFDNTPKAKKEETKDEKQDDIDW